MKLLFKSLVLVLGLAAASPALAFSYSCADWKDPDLMVDFWGEATRAIIADCVQDMGFAMGFSVKDRDDYGLTPLHWSALFSRNPEVITALLEAGADINARDDMHGRSPLHSAAIGNHNPDVIKTLLQSGADVNTRELLGMTPLHRASDTSNLDVIPALIEAGADVNARNGWGETPLHEAASSPYDSAPDVIIALLKAGADVNARDEDGWTPLHRAADRNTNPDVIIVLLEAGADGSLTDSKDKTPFDLAKENVALKNTDAYWALNDARFK
jgi:ankyrin repeat protein